MEIRPLREAENASFDAIISFENPRICISDVGDPWASTYKVRAQIYHKDREKPDDVEIVFPLKPGTALSTCRATIYLADFRQKLLNLLGPPDTTGEVTKIFETIVSDSLEFSDDFTVTGNNVDINPEGLTNNFDSGLFEYSAPNITITLGNGLWKSGGLAVKTVSPISIVDGGVSITVGDLYSSMFYTKDFENGAEETGKINVKLGHGMEHTTSGIQPYVKEPLYFDDSDDYKLTVRLKDPQEYLKIDESTGTLYYDSSYALSNLYSFGLGLTLTGNVVDVGVSSPLYRDADGIWIQQSTSGGNGGPGNPIKCEKGGVITLLYDEETLGVQPAGGEEYELYVIDTGPPCAVPYQWRRDRELVW